MIVQQALHRARETLYESGIVDASLVSELLLGEAVSKDRLQLYVEANAEIAVEQEAAFWSLIRRCLNGEPVAYITGHREFYGLDFYVDHRVLIPRPETELLVDKALALARQNNAVSIADIGTGSGAIAISLSLNLNGVMVYATDVSSDALQVAAFNCRKHGVDDNICLLCGDLAAPLPGPVDIIVANLPYVRSPDIYGPLAFEPRSALDGGADGLDQIRRLVSQVPPKLRPKGSLLLEIGQGQGEAVTALVKQAYPLARIELAPDLAGIERVVRVEFDKS